MINLPIATRPKSCGLIPQSLFGILCTDIARMLRAPQESQQKPLSRDRMKLTEVEASRWSDGQTDS